MIVSRRLLRSTARQREGRPGGLPGHLLVAFLAAFFAVFFAAGAFFAAFFDAFFSAIFFSIPPQRVILDLMIFSKGSRRIQQEVRHREGIRYP